MDTDQKVRDRIAAAARRGECVICGKPMTARGEVSHQRKHVREGLMTEKWHTGFSRNTLDFLLTDAGRAHVETQE